MNHGGGDGIWSENSKLLLWVTEGKWTTDSVVVVKFKGADVAWMIDLSPPCQKAILVRTKAADPAASAREKEWNKDNGAAYPEGFTIDVSTGDASGEEPRLPLKVRVDLTSNPKGNSDADAIQHQAIDAWLDATLDEYGVLTFGKFQAERRPDLKNSWAY